MYKRVAERWLPEQMQIGPYCSVYGSVLFNIFMNNIRNDVKGKLSISADDTKRCRFLHIGYYSNILLKHLENLEAFCR